ncbi:MAG TPA: hypothetical protein ENK85_10785 [Saprospiraceae bacterium]|nr:hypothetical protein [Saprospiraceae bacterium]
MNRIKQVLGLVFLFLGLVSCVHSDRADAVAGKSEKLKVGVFNGNGASPVCVLETMEALKIDQGIEPKEVSAADILNGQLDQLDVLVFPGGSGSKEYNNLGQQAADIVKDFGQKEGKGLVGICAGGYLMASTPTYPNLDLLKTPHTRKFYDRGRGLISFHLNEAGKKIFYELKNTDSIHIQYYDGPIFDQAENSDLNVLGEVNSDIATHKGYPHDFTPGKPAFFTKDFGNGKIFVSVGHPEATAGMRWMVPRMARYVANKELVTYTKPLIRPEINNKEILFYSDTKKLEKRLFWKLMDKDPNVVAAAMDSLSDLRSRPSIRWSIGLLRHKDWNIRLKAAKYLLFTEYTAAIPDLEAAVNFEKEPSHKKELQKILNQLQGFIGQNTGNVDL